MNREESEWLLVGGSFLLGPIVAGLLALPIFSLTQNIAATIMIGTVVGMGIYVTGCWLQFSKYRGQAKS